MEKDRTSPGFSRLLRRSSSSCKCRGEIGGRPQFFLKDKQKRGLSPISLITKDCFQELLVK